jgi:hypothetical protein
MYIAPDQLKKYILDAKLISLADLQSAEKEAEKSKKDIGDVLVSEGKMSEDDFWHSIC